MPDINRFLSGFSGRHIGPNTDEQQSMLESCGCSTLDQLISQTIPDKIRLTAELNLPHAITEHEFLAEATKLASENKVAKSYIGVGYYQTLTPPVIQRNVLENPGWYTAYTPYQAEIAQGRLEMLLNFQTMVCDLTGMEICNASLLDEATSAAEAMTMLYSLRKPAKKKAETFFVSDAVHPQTIDVIKTRASSVGINIMVGKLDATALTNDVYAVLVQYPDTYGEVVNYAQFCQQAQQANIFTCFATDLLALTLLTPPGQWGADVVVGSSQRFGVPMGFGGPHAGFLATTDAFKRAIPGRIIGKSVDADGNPAYRMALQTREQHIRREKATSNICTAQALLAITATAYAIYHGPMGLTEIANQVHRLATQFYFRISNLGLQVLNQNFFDSVSFKFPKQKIAELQLKLESEVTPINLRYFADGETVSVSFDEAKSDADLDTLVSIIASVLGNHSEIDSLTENVKNLDPELIRQTSFLTAPVFNQHHSEHQLTRYLKSLENKDLSLVHSMISLGSCTMKLNATAQMLPITLPGFANIHPFAPQNQVGGYLSLINELSEYLCQITGFDAVSLQPNSGAQGEYAGLLAIKRFHDANGNHQRNIALIPSSAHGTNPASSVMAGMQVVVVACDAMGNIDVADLEAKAKLHANHLGALMVTYPSTHGVFEDQIIEICQMIHDFGGQVYMDGANMNAQVGLTSPATIGADVCHLNLHKTFAIPHGGGGPGVGPIAVRSHLAPYLPGHSVTHYNLLPKTTAVSAAPFGSPMILPIPLGYIKMLGKEGVKKASEVAILNANYIKSRLEACYSILYTNAQGRVAHELIVDFRMFKQHHIEVEDVAKRLMDYGFHAPTVSFPVAGTLMIEPTESEGKAEIDRFCDALIAIKHEIDEIVTGVADASDNVLKNAPHTAAMVTADNWPHSYTRQKAAYPLPYLVANKFWPSVRRIDSAFGDRNLICTCNPIADYATA